MKILIVEDDKKICGLLKVGFKREGYETDCVFNGLEAERKITNFGGDYDLIILDLMLPGRSGFDVCRKIREKNLSLPVFVVTAKNEDEDKKNAFENGADDYITKPFSFKELLNKVNSAIAVSGNKKNGKASFIRRAKFTKT